jgi:hypothetical protein
MADNPFDPDPSTQRSDPATIVSRISRYSYGVPISEPFDPHRHHWRDQVIDPSSGEIHARNQMEWLLKRVRRQLTYFMFGSSAR